MGRPGGSDVRSSGSGSGSSRAGSSKGSGSSGKKGGRDKKGGGKGRRQAGKAQSGPDDKARAAPGVESDSESLSAAGAESSAEGASDGGAVIADEPAAARTAPASRSEPQMGVQIGRMQGRLNTLERDSMRLRRGFDALHDLEPRLQQALADLAHAQSQELESVRAQVELLRQENADLRSRLTVTSGGGAAQFARRLGNRLPGALREPLRHAFYRSLAAVKPDSPLLHAYRQSQSDMHLSVTEQRKLFDKVMKARRDDKADIIMMPVIDWHFRIQRPQHIASCLGELGHRVFYLTTTFARYPGQPGFNILESPAKNVFVVQLYCPEPHPESIYNQPPTEMVADGLAAGLAVLAENFHIDQSVSIVQQPFWRMVAERLQGSLMAYDCMDYHGGFTTHTDVMGREEDLLLQSSDLVVTTSQGLQDRVGVPSVLIRNAAEVEHFTKAPASLAFKSERPVVGYYGAISSWFDMDLMVDMAKRFPQWDFVLVGSTFEGETAEAEAMPNMRFTGEVPYADLPQYLYAFDVCTIPFKIIDLTLCTNPVKVYEYLCAGKPVVSTELPEVVQLGDQVHTASDRDGFAARLEQAMAEKDDRQLARRRIRYAQTQGWTQRGEAYEAAVRESYPKVSVVVLSYKSVDLLKACLHSLEKFSAYPNLELIVVDNDSDEATKAFLREYETVRPLARIDDVKVIFNDENLGFAAGNNVGMKVATGDYVILLNNDTFVTRGWVLDMIRHLRTDPQLGLVGAITNNIGNEAKIDIEYPSMEDMAVAARRYTMAHARRLLPVANVAFFCVGMSRDTMERVGYLDEAFTRGFFEDDDYCNRVRELGLKVGIAEDVFVHHHLSASFNAIDQTERQKLFEDNKRIYESKWGAWQPHTYRRES